MEYAANFTIQSSIATAVLLYLCTSRATKDGPCQPRTNDSVTAPFAIDAIYKVL
jgi:hypothetical protein